MVIEERVAGRSAAAAVGASLPFSTKLIPPRLVAGQTLRRPRLLNLLHRALPGRATVVTAPAGYGKTTLLAQFAAEVDAPVAWYSADDGDRDPTALLMYLAGAVARHIPRFGERVLAMLSAGGTGSAGGAGDDLELVRTATGQFVSALNDEVPDFLVLIVDDCHAIAGSAGAAHVIDLLLQYLPDHCHLMLGGRSLPELPALARQVALRRATRVDQAKLRLTLDETRDLVRLAGVRDPTPEHVAALDSQAQGWAIAVTLLAACEAAPESLESDSEESGGSGEGARGNAQPHLGRGLPRPARDALFAYFAADVLDRQPALLQSLLLDASVLPIVDVDRCASLVGRPPQEVERLLATAESRSLFLTRLEDDWNAADGADRTAYRFHDLFRQYLADTLRAQQPVRYRWLHRRAAHLAAAAGDVVAAVRHALTAKHYALAARLIDSMAPAFERGGQWHLIRSWTQALPRPVISRWPHLLLLAAKAEYHLSRDVRRAGEYLAMLEASANASGSVLLAARLLRSKLLAHRGQFSEAAGIAEQCAALTDELGEAAPRAAAQHQLGLCSFRLGDIGRATAALQDAVRLHACAADDYGEATSREGLAVVHAAAGRIGEAVSELRLTDRMWRKMGNERCRARNLNNLGEACFALGDYPAALAHFRETLGLARHTADGMLEACALLGIGTVERDSGSLECAQATIERGVALATELGSAALTRSGTDALAHVHRLLGHFELAGTMLRGVLYEAVAAGSKREEGIYLRSLAHVLADCGEYAEAESHASRSLERLVSAAAAQEVARTHLLRAHIAFCQHRKGAAKKELTAMVAVLTQLGHHGFLLADARHARRAIEYGVTAGCGGVRLTALRDDAIGAACANPPATNGTSTVPERVPENAPSGASGRCATVAGADSKCTKESATLAAWGFGRSRVECRLHEPGGVRWRGPKSRELLFYLLCNRGWQHRERITTSLWPELDQVRARSNFHINVLRLRRTLFQHVLEEAGGRYRLHPDVAYWFDVEEFVRCCLEATQGLDREGGVDAACQAVDLYGGEFLEDLPSDWSTSYRVKLETLFVEVVLSLGRHRQKSGHPQEAEALARRALALDPNMEAALELLISSLVSAGHDAAAEREILAYRQRRIAEGGGAPSAQVERLAARLRAPHPARDQALHGFCPKLVSDW